MNRHKKAVRKEKPKRFFPNFLRVTSVFAPELQHTTLHVDENRTVYVYDAQIISVIRELLAFRLEIFEPPDGPFGSELPDGNWTGMIGMLHREEADIAISKITATEERTDVVDFTHPYHYTSETFITDRPEYLSNRYAIFYPFSLSMWICVFASMMVIALLCHVLKGKDGGSYSMLLKIFGSLFDKSVNFKFRKLRCRWIVISWVIGALFITHSYKAVLLSFLTFPSVSGISDIPQLAKATDSRSFKCSGYPGSYMHETLLESDDENLRKVGECLYRTNIFVEDPEDFLRDRTYKKAFIGERTDMIAFSESYFISSDTFLLNMITVAVRKTFCCKRVLDELILEIAQVGLLQKFDRDEAFFLALDKSYLRSDDIYSGMLSPVSLDDLFGAFLFLISGYALGLVTLVVEVQLARKKTSRKPNFHSKKKFRRNKVYPKTIKVVREMRN